MATMGAKERAALERYAAMESRQATKLQFRQEGQGSRPNSTDFTETRSADSSKGRPEQGTGGSSNKGSTVACQ